MFARGSMWSARTAKFSRFEGPQAVAGASGYTLIEIMIVVGLIAIIMATGIPAFTRHAKKETLMQAVNDVVEACNTARAHAILQNTTMEIVFRAHDGHIAVRPAQLGNEKDRLTGAAPEVVAPGEAAVGEIQGFNFADDVMIEMLDINMFDQMQQPTARVLFYPNGTSDELTLVLSTPRGGRRKIDLEVVTALPNVEEMK